MKKYLKNNDGMALPMVLVIMTILSLFAVSMAMLAYNSYMSVKWMNEEKRAYYLARAGVEASSYAYQNAVTKTSGSFDNLGNFGSFTEIDKFVTIAQDSDEIIKTNRVYLRYNDSAENDGTRWNGLEFKTYVSDSEALADSSCIGYFEVEMGNGTDKITVSDSLGNKSEQDVSVKVFKATASCGKKTQVAFGYVAPADNVAAGELYSDDGYLSQTGVTPDDAKNYGTNGQFIKDTKTIKFDTDISDDSDRFLTRLWKGIVKMFFGWLYPSGRDIPLYVKTGEGNLVLSKPENSKFIKVNPKADNFYIFATTGDLFLEDTGLQVNPTKGYYASVGLYGDEIVIDGDITMEVYYTNPDPLAGKVGNQWNSFWAMMGNRFRLGTVVLGEASEIPTDRRDPVKLSNGGLQYKGQSVPANKVYFNGNVFLKIYTQGGSTETYRVFNAGDMAYFYGGYTLSGALNGESFDTRGVDLLKYFIDAVIAEKDGFNYGDAVKQKMRKINELYYGGNEDSYFADGNVLVRKINVKYNANGKVVVDGGAGNVGDIIQPSPTDSTSLTWGRPVGGDIFQ